MQALQGVTPASFKSRAAALVVDFFLADGVFLIILIGGSKLLSWLGISNGDVNLKF